MNIKKYLVVLPFLASCNGLGKSNMNPEGQSSQGAGSSTINQENSKKLETRLITKDYLVLISRILGISTGNVSLHDVITNVDKIQKELGQSKYPQNQIEIFINLIQHFINYNKQTIHDQVIYDAINTGSPELVYALCKNGVDANKILRLRPTGMSYGLSHIYTFPLRAAAEKNLVQVAEVLLERGAKVDKSNGYTALHRASICGHLDLVVLLVRTGADLSIKSQLGDTALDLARQYGHKEIVEFLTKAAIPQDRHCFFMRYFNNPVRKHYHLPYNICKND